MPSGSKPLPEPMLTQVCVVIWPQWVNTMRPKQNGHCFPDDIFQCIFLNENIWISMNISLKFVPKGPINNIPALVQIMAWHWQGDKPLSEPLMVRLSMHICITRPQWVNLKLLPEPMLVAYHHQQINFVLNKRNKHRWNLNQNTIMKIWLANAAYRIAAFM